MEKNNKVIIFDYDETIKIRHKEIDDIVPKLINDLVNEGYIIALASLNMSAPECLKKDNIYDLFEKIEYRKDVENLDKSEMFKNIIKEFNVEMKDCLLFDDNEIHCTVADELGMKYILVDDRKCVTYEDIQNGKKLLIN